MSDLQTPMEYLQSRVKSMLREHATFIVNLKCMSQEDKSAEWLAIENLYKYVQDYGTNMAKLQAYDELQAQQNGTSKKDEEPEL